MIGAGIALPGNCRPSTLVRDMSDLGVRPLDEATWEDPGAEPGREGVSGREGRAHAALVCDGPRATRRLGKHHRAVTTVVL